jgi:hypothetical protein
MASPLRFHYVLGSDSLSLYVKEKVTKRSAPRRGLLQSRPLLGFSPPANSDGKNKFKQAVARALKEWFYALDPLPLRE